MICPKCKCCLVCQKEKCFCPAKAGAGERCRVCAAEKTLLGWKPMEVVYPNETHFSDYNPLLRSMGYDVLVQVDDQAYHGDSRVLYSDGERYGILVFGWGSCSGCDALKDCCDHDAVERLRDELWNKIEWYTREDLIKYLDGKDCETEYAHECWLEFRRKVFKVIKEPFYPITAKEG